MDNKATSWIHAGIRVLARTGKLELNEVCRERGKFKPSFYHIYPNFEDSRGMDRFIDDVLQHHQRILLAFFDSIRRLYILYSDMDKTVHGIVDLLAEYLDYHKCSALLRNSSQTDPKMEKYWERIYPEYIKVINEFYRIYNFPEDLILDQHGMRLMFDSFLTYKNKEEYYEDGKAIIYSRARLRGDKKQNPEPR